MVKQAAVEGIVLLVFGLAGMADGLRLVIFKNRASVEDFTGPGRYLFVIGVLLAVVGAVYLAVMRRVPEPESANTEDGGSDSTLVAVVAVLAVYIFLIDLVGYFWATQVFFLLIMRVLGLKFSPRMTIIGATMGVGFYLLFVWLFGMSFPKGMIFS